MPPRSKSRSASSSSEASFFALPAKACPFRAEITPCYDWRMRALVTGGTGRVGSAIASRLEDAGWSVLAAGRTDGDVSRPNEARALVARAVSELGGLDLLVNGASEGFAPTDILELTEPDWDLAFGATAKASCLGTHAAA